MFIRVCAAALRRTTPLCAAVLLLAVPGCRKDDRAAENDVPGTISAAGAKEANDLHLAYSHDIAVGLPARRVEPHFVAPATAASKTPSCTACCSKPRSNRRRAAPWIPAPI